MVQRRTKAGYDAGFKGKIISCTGDGYRELDEQTDVEFMEGFIFQFPELDDPELYETAFFFHQPKRFFDEYNRRFPECWSAVSWEYVSILDIWHAGVERAGSTTCRSVLAAMKQHGQVTHTFGDAKWWGKDLFGIENALVGDWPVVQIKDGRAVIVEFGSVRDWLVQHEKLLQQEIEALGQMWFQRLGSDARIVQLS